MPFRTAYCGLPRSLRLPATKCAAPMKYVTPFTDADMTTVQQMHAHHPSRRARMRAQSLLLSPQRSPLPQMARL
jgi:hypothetical protein